jgi:hypothetical protein
MSVNPSSVVFKRDVGGNLGLKSRCEHNKKIEVSLKAQMINQMIEAAA